MLKYQQMVELLSRRIGNGEYPGGKLPAIRQLAEDTGVSYMTARKAVLALKNSGLIAHDEANRRIFIDSRDSARPRVCMISSLWSFTEWHRLVRDTTRRFNGHIHFATYGSDTDPVITEMLGHDFDVFFVMLPVNRKNGRLLERLRKLGKKVVVLFHDLSDMGIRALLGPDPSCARTIMEKLRDHGCRRIDVVSTGDRHSADLELRLKSWRDFKDRHGLAGECHLPDIEPFQRVEVEIYRYCRDLLDARPFPDAVYCLTPPVAMAIYRVCADRGLRVGKDISIFSFGDPAFCGIMTPRLATINATVGMKPLFEELIGQYRPGHDPDDRLVFQSGEYEIDYGESLCIDR